MLASSKRESLITDDDREIQLTCISAVKPQSTF